MLNFMSFGENIGIDLGTATVLVYIKGQGIVIREPSVVAIDKDTNTILAVGEEARRMLGEPLVITLPSALCVKVLFPIMMQQKKCCSISSKRLWVNVLS